MPLWDTGIVKLLHLMTLTNNLMKVEASWVISADKALKSNHIKIVKQPTSERPYYHYQSVYKGYISSFGASVVQCGLVAACSFFEKRDSDADESRFAVIKAISEVLKEQKKLPDNIDLSSVYALQNKSDKRLLKNIDKAVAALKLAIRQYEGIKCKEDGKNDKKQEEKKWKDAPAISEEEFSEKYECHQDNKCSNIGWLFYRDYYRNFVHIQTNILVKSSKDRKEVKKGTNMELMYKKQNEYICRSSLRDLNKENTKLLEALPCNTKLYFKTIYPGLLIGAGLSHGTGTNYDMKIGFQFDYTTGLPYIPGSSIKGVLRSMFPLTKLLKEPQKKEELIYNERRIRYIREKMDEISDKKISDTYSDSQIVALTKAIFEEPFYNALNDNIKKKDVFMDALITQTEHEKGFFIGDDFITCHKNPLQNPIPLQFLKVLSEVTFCFPFYLHDSYIENKVFTKSMKAMLFQHILEDIGVGAKTNVGYGQLEFIYRK